jgi:hypothetical protein
LKCITDLWSESFKRELKLSSEWQDYVESLNTVKEVKPDEEKEDNEK